jgi:hypothetical protein
LPIGWGTVRDCTEPKARCNWLDQRRIFTGTATPADSRCWVLVGFLIVIIALVTGARRWFGLLSKLDSLRATGRSPLPREASPALDCRNRPRPK